LGRADSQRMIEERTRIVLRPLASPLPLAFFAFGVGSLMLSGQQLGLIPDSETRTLALILGLFVFPLQALAAVLSFVARETLGATALGLISGSWLAGSAIMYTSPPDATTAAYGIFQICIAVMLLLLGVIGLQGKPLISAIILLAFFRFGLNGFFELTAAPWTQPVSGVIGLLIFLFALYGGLALGLEDAQHRTVLPLGRRGEALEAVEGDLSDQVGPIEKEAGVRKQL
jgi:succinate-acetate transporter protein